MLHIFAINQTHLKRVVAILILIYCFCSPKEAYSSEIDVFILHSYHQEYPRTKLENRGIINTFNSLFAGKDISYSTEYLDTKRVNFSEQYQLFFKDYLHHKYAGYTPQIIFVSDDDALQFMVRFRKDLFSEVPIVFCGVNDTSKDLRLREDNIYGIFEVKDIVTNLKLIRRLLNDIETVTFVGDRSTTSMVIHREIQELTAENQLALKTEFISDTQIAGLVSKLQQKQRDILVLASVGSLHDDHGHTITIPKVIEQLRDSGDYIIFSMEDADIGVGVLGGFVSSCSAQGAAAAIKGVALLSGKVIEPKDRFGNGPSFPTFNYNELTRLGISLNQLPDDAQILGKPQSLYEEFQNIIHLGIAAFAIMLVLVVFLSMSVMRRKKAEQDLQASENFLSSALDNLPDMVFVKDAEDLQFVRLNKKGEEIFGAKQENVIGKTDFDFFPEEEAAFFTQKDRQTLENRILVDVPEEPIHTPEGLRYLHTKKIPILDAQGRPKYLLGISRDITELKRAEQQKRELEDKLKQSQKMESIGTLAGGIAHDFNNILSSIIGYTELAKKQTTQPENVSKLLDGTLKGAERAKQLVHQILTFSRKGASERVSIVLADVIQQNIALLRSSLPSTITIEEHLNTRSCVHADPTQMHQIIMNLGTNGYQAMLDKGGKLLLKLEEEEIGGSAAKVLGIDPGWYLHFTIQDTGQGMDKQTLERMFDPYFTTKGLEAGTGLGLAVVHGIVKNHGGSITVISKPDNGTTVDIYLPVSESAGAKTSIQEQADKILGGNESILLVDDEQDIVQITKSYLVDYGYRVTAFNSSLETLLEFKKNPDSFDLLITDMTMPRMNGIELAEEIWCIKPQFPVVLCASHGDNINRTTALTRGVRAYCEKPMNIGEILTAVREVLDT